MKFILLFFIVGDVALGQVIDLGTLDSREQMLDQRFIMTPSEKDRENSLRTFFSDREFDFNNEILSHEEIKVIKPDEEWNKLLEGHL